MSCRFALGIVAPKCSGIVTDANKAQYPRTWRKRTPLEEFETGEWRGVLFLRVLGQGTCQIENPPGGGPGGFLRSKSGSYICVLGRSGTWQVNNLSSSACQVELCIVLDSVSILTWQATTEGLSSQRVKKKGEVAPLKTQAQVVRRTIRL